MPKKLHWAIHGQTAAEVIVNRADAEKEHMGLTTWKDGPKGKIQKFDVSVAKNYLSKDEGCMYGRATRAGKPDVFAKGRFLALDGHTKWVKYRTFNIDGMA